MIVELINETKNMKCTFVDDVDFVKIFSYQSTLNRCYGAVAEDYKTFRMSNAFGFYKNNTVNPYTVDGVNENGVNFKANSFSAKLISWNFKNVVTNVSESPISPNQYLNTLLLTKNDVLLVKVTTSRVFQQYFHVTPETDTESQIIQLESSSGGDGIYWSIGDLSFEFFFFGNYNPYIIKNLPQVLLNEKAPYPFENDVFSAVDTTCKVQIGGSLDTGSWESATVENVQTGDLFTFDNTVPNTDYVIVDSDNLTVTDPSGTDLLSFFSGDFINLTSGENTFRWWLNSTDYEEAQEYLPLNTSLQVTSEGLVSSIE